MRNLRIMRSSQEAFALTEVMIALAIIGLGLSSGIVAMCTAIGWVKETKDRQFALHTAREHMEVIRASGFKNLDSGSHSHTNIIKGRTTFETAYTVAVSGMNTNIKDLAVQVSWARSKDSSFTCNLQLVTTVSNSMN